MLRIALALLTVVCTPGVAWAVELGATARGGATSIEEGAFNLALFLVVGAIALALAHGRGQLRTRGRTLRRFYRGKSAT